MSGRGTPSETIQRYPLGPLLKLTGWSMRDVRGMASCSGPEYRIRIERGVTALVADRLAIAAGLHPAEIWTTWFDDAPPAPPAPSSTCEECRGEYETTNALRRFCSDKCQKANYQRRYRTRPEVQQKNRERRNAFYWECRDYELARQRRYDAQRAHKRVTESPPLSSSSTQTGSVSLVA
jgi:endogenous inhibitor of DNA gyrase (YacG/DUF329 family)